MTALLETRELEVKFGGLNAVDGVSLRVGEGRVVGLIGPNGAGKTTFIDAVTGFVPVARGRVVFDGEDVTQWSPHRRAQRGLGRTFQSLELFDDLTVRENLLVTAVRHRWWSVLADALRPSRISAAEADTVEWALDVLELADQAERFPAELSHGQRKLVAVARALAARPRLLLLDEPAAGLDTEESEVLSTQLRKLVQHSITVLLIDHDMGLVLGACDEIYVLEFGALIARGGPAEIRRDPKVIGAYLGTHAAQSGAGGGVPGEELR